MEAIFSYPDNFMDDAIKHMRSYFESSSLRSNVELGKFKHSYNEGCYSPSSTYFVENADEIIDKIKEIVEKVLRRLREFIEDTKVNIRKYKEDKERLNKLKRLEEILDKNPILKGKLHKWTDRKPIVKFIEEEKKALRVMVRKQGTTSEELKIEFDRWKKQLSDKQKLAIGGATITLGVLISKSFIDGIRDGINDIESDTKKINRELDDLNGNKSLDVEKLKIYYAALAELNSLELLEYRESLKDHDKTVNSVISNITKKDGD